MSEQISYEIPLSFAKRIPIIDEKKHQELYQYSINDPEGFWAEQAKEFITWFKPWRWIKTGNFGDRDLSWFLGGKLNACYNCIDRHLEKNADGIAIIWEGDNPNESKTFTYQELYHQVCSFANALKKMGIKKGDRVCIYLPMIPEIAISMLACARIGAIHSVVFGGFSADALKARILDADCCLLITADEGVRGGKFTPLKKNADDALEGCPNVKQTIVVKRTGNPISWNKSRDHWYHEILKNSNWDCPIEVMDATDPLFILYTSGSTGKPKGVLHATGGYLVYSAITHKYVFDYHQGDIYWCTADIGWITGHSYTLYGPLTNGATTLLFEGVPHHPNYSRYWEIIDKYKVNIFYTSPTALRALRHEGDGWVNRTSRKSLVLLGSVGEPINPEVWKWYHRVVGENRCPIVDTWWQTETGGIIISALPGAMPLKPGSACKPFFGIDVEIVDDDGKPTPSNTRGNLVIKQPWPGLMQTIYGNPQRFIETYFKIFPGKYLSGDGAHCDEEGYYWIEGRLDDVIKVSGHRIGTEEVESALLTHPSISEAAVVAIPHDIKGQAIYAFITVMANITPDDQLKNELILHVRNHLGAIATPEIIQWAKALPKTRSGKIMRRILRKVANNEFDTLDDLSTLADPGVIEELINQKKLL